MTDHHIAPSPPPDLERLLGRARLAMLWEAAWPPLAFFGTIVLVFLAVSWFGVWDMVPPWGRIVGVVLFAALAGLALFPLVRLRPPSRAGLLARVDRASGRIHRPATALAEPLASPGDDPVTRALWDAHRARAAQAARNLTSGPVRPGLTARDPRAFRFLAILVAFIAFAQAGGEHGARIAAAFDWRSPAGATTTPPRLDAWVTPPAYTGRPPIFLTNAQPADTERAAITDQPAALSVPAGSVLVIRTSGGGAEIEATGGARAVEVDAAQTTSGAPPVAAGTAIAEHRFSLDSDAQISARPRSGDTRHWRFAIVPDRAPEIAFQSVPRLDERGALVLETRMEDDYGITGAQAEIARTEPVPARRKADAVPPRPLYGAPEIRLALPQGRTRSGPATTTYHGIDHPWAGARVLITLVARDEAGQEGRSEQLEAVLPSRTFSHPLARALVEQRRILALDARSRDRVAETLDALALFPEKFTPQSGIYLGLRAAYWRLAKARSDDDLRTAADYLWEMALQLEEGNLPGLGKDLQAAEKALRDALDRNAPDDEIKRLMDELRSALNQFMQEFARQAQQNPQRQAQIPPNARVLTPQDMKDMMDRLENLARGGDKQAAKDMLSELRDLLNNLQQGQTAQQQGGESGQDPQSQALDELGRMIREQSELRDKTFQQGQQGDGQQGQENGEGQQQGQQGQQNEQGRQGQNGMGQLGQQQGALQKRLQELMRSMEGQGMEGEGALGEAGEAMGRAQGQMGDGDAEGAVGQQGRALDALRQGARNMAERMQQGQGQGQGQAQGRPGQRGQSANGEDTDPLGRPTRARRYDPGSNVRVPGEIEAQRARRIQEELRRRVGEPSRPQDEIDYLERLLRE
ncbi:TIGR02302 family protein [Terrihabitans sp. B22-R8]|uniref:TIGR02302 family protein n=1 Tax=Terrihabitans sp. B22-R8 TaxID=3425128 RepID=UPI00403C7C41